LPVLYRKRNISLQTQRRALSYRYKARSIRYYIYRLRYELTSYYLGSIRHAAYGNV